MPDPADVTPPVPIPAPPTPEARVRFARLRPEFASLYAGLDPGAWYPADSVAAYFRAWLVRHPGLRPGAASMRGLETAHFEFRGGVPRDAPWLPGQSPDDRQARGAAQNG
jgi:hypothetical protein